MMDYPSLRPDDWTTNGGQVGKADRDIIEEKYNYHDCVHTEWVLSLTLCK